MKSKYCNYLVFTYLEKLIQNYLKKLSVKFDEEIEINIVVNNFLRENKNELHNNYIQTCYNKNINVNIISQSNSFLKKFNICKSLFILYKIKLKINQYDYLFTPLNTLRIKIFNRMYNLPSIKCGSISNSLLHGVMIIGKKNIKIKNRNNILKIKLGKISIYKKTLNYNILILCNYLYKSLLKLNKNLIFNNIFITSTQGTSIKLDLQLILNYLNNLNK